MRFLRNRAKGSWTNAAPLMGLLLLGMAVIYGIAGNESFAATEKWLIQQGYEDLRKQPAPLAKPNPVAARPAASPDEPWPTGIFEEGQAPFPAAAVTVNNQWQGVVNGQYVQVYAGALPDAPAQGVVIVAVTTVDLQPVSTQWIAAPANSGTLRLVAERNLQLTLESTRGLSFVFDVPSRKLLKAVDK